jgi:hypothetical protein
MSCRVACFILLGGWVSAIGVAQGAGIDGLVARPRVFNDHPTSLLSISSSNSVNDGAVTIDDQFTAAGAGANRHDVLLSANGGASAAVFNIANRFTFQTQIELTGAANSPRKEAGIRLNSPITGDVLFIINSDAGEIVAFGGGGPFYLFGNNAAGNGYTTGSTLLMGFTYIGPFGATAGTLNYFIDRDPGQPGGESSSGPLAFSNLEFGALDFNVGMYAQSQSGGAGDFIHAEFRNIRFAIVPEPGTYCLFAAAIASLAATRRIR